MAAGWLVSKGAKRVSKKAECTLARRFEYADLGGDLLKPNADSTCDCTTKAPCGTEVCACSPASTPFLQAYDSRFAQQLAAEYSHYAPLIRARLAEFRAVGENGSDEDIFAELAFCLLTPQSKARLCWEAVGRLRQSGLLLAGTAAAVEGKLAGVRFHRTKAKRIIEARNRFFPHGKLLLRPMVLTAPAPEAREWLVRNVAGLGYKEASHFLRNIGRGEDLAILDRHVIKNLVAARVLDIAPHSMTREKYLAIEQQARAFARSLGLSLGELDLLLWARETGEVFK